MYFKQGDSYLELKAQFNQPYEPFIARKNYNSFVLTKSDSQKILIKLYTEKRQLERELDITIRVPCDCTPSFFKLNEISQTHLARNFNNEVTLRQILIKNGKIEINKVINLSLQLLDFLKICHREDIIFRAITPDNILIDRFNKLHILDFQDCFIIGEDFRYADPGAEREGIEYLSPEYLHRYQLDFRNDIYQLGLLLFELITGVLPWQYRSVARLLDEKNKPVIPLHRVEDKVPIQFSMLISKMMEPIPKNRFSNVTQIQELLEEAISLQYGVSI